MSFLAHHENPTDSGATPIHLIAINEWDGTLTSLETQTQNWVKAHCTTANAGDVISCPNADGTLACVVACVDDLEDGLWTIAHLPSKLQPGTYYLVKQLGANSLIGWCLDQYTFERYLKKEQEPGRILLHSNESDVNTANSMIKAHNLSRNLINMPTNDMGPSHLAEASATLADEYGAKCSVLVGDEVLNQNYPMVHAVGRAAENAPRLIDVIWGDDSHPKLTLVGKGVCFDTGGLDIKPYSSMKMMKKDMGGAAFVLGLAEIIMSQELPVRLRVLVPAVENSVSDNAFRPQDILTARDGTTVEIGSTDAEGRLILADALVEADSEKPDFILDVATLTGAARVALGTQVPAVFSKNQYDGNELVSLSVRKKDALWQLPLWEDYNEFIKPVIADLANSASTSFGGAITAALFLKHFVKETENWMHIDTMGWNLTSRPGRPAGGEALGLHSVYTWLEKRYRS